MGGYSLSNVDQIICNQPTSSVVVSGMSTAPSPSFLNIFAVWQPSTPGSAIMFSLASTILGATTVNSWTGNEVAPFVTHTGTITSAYGFCTSPVVASGGAGTIGSWYGYYSGFQNYGHTVTNLYGVYVEDMTAGGTNVYELFLAGTAGAFFRQATEYINSDDADHLDLHAATRVDLNAAAVIGDGGTTNYAAFAADGELTLHGTARVTKIALMQWYTTTGGSSAENYIYGSALDAATDEFVYWTGYVPLDIVAGTDIALKYRWVNKVAVSGGGDVVVQWDGDYNYAGSSGVLGAPKVLDVWATTITDPTPVQTIYEESATLANLTAGDFLSFRLRRDADAGADTYGSDVMVFVNAYIEYTADKLGEAT